MEISYDGVSTSIFGKSVAIENMVFKPRMIADEIHLAALKFRAPSFMFLLDIEKEMKGGGAPERFGLSLEGLKLRVDGPIVEAIYQQNPDQALRNDYFSLGCGDKEVIGPLELLEMGYLDVVMNIHMDYQLKPIEQELFFSMVMEMVDMGDVEFEGGFVNEGGKLTVQNSQKAVATLKHATIRYRDSGYNQRLQTLCGSEIGTDRSGFINRHMEAILAELENAGIEPSEQLVGAYRKYLEGSGEIALNVNPSSPFQLASLALYKPEDVLYLLDPQLTMGGQQMSIQNHLKLSEAKRPAKPQPDVAVKPESNVAITKPSTTIKKRRRASSRDKTQFRRIAPSELANHIGSVVSLRTKSGKLRKGVLKTVRKGSIEVQIKMRSGTMAFPVLLRDIAEVEVATK